MSPALFPARDVVVLLRASVGLKAHALSDPISEPPAGARTRNPSRSDASQETAMDELERANRAMDELAEKVRSAANGVAGEGQQFAYRVKKYMDGEMAFREKLMKVLREIRPA